jgi:hypothetical protein
MMPRRLKADELRLADTVDLGFSPWGWAIVKQIMLIRLPHTEARS